MRGFIVMAMFAASLAQAGSKQYSEVRDLELAAEGLSELFIDAGAGELIVTGVEGAGDIRVTATITVDDGDAENTRKYLEKRLRLTLERDGDRGVLISNFRNNWTWSSGGTIDLDVRVPAGLDLRVDDGSGAIRISDVVASVKVDDGSGPMEISNTGPVDIDDGSGSITIRGAAGDVYINDGSGSISITSVSGSVRIDDGSGSIDVDDVEKDLILDDIGSGAVTYTNVRGVVEQDD